MVKAHVLAEIMMKCGTLETPAPFVFGGSFSDFKKEGRKFRRFTTLSSLAKAADIVGTVDEPTRDEQIQQMYSEAREQGIGTVNRIDIPEGSVNIVNLVEVARYIQATLMPGSIVDDEEDEEEEDVDEEVDEEGEEFIEELDEVEDLPWAPPEEDEVSESLEQHAFHFDDDEPLLAPLEHEEVSKSMPAMNCDGSLSKCDLDIATPIVYGGSFQEYKNEDTKILRFSTLANFSKAVERESDCSEAETSATEHLEPTTQPMSVSRDLESAEESSTSSTHSFIESPLLDGCMPCQLLALAMPPSMQQESSVYVTLSDGIVKKALRPTLAESQAAVKTIVAPREFVPTTAIASDMLPKSAQISRIASKSPYRFRFMSDELGAINTSGLSSAKMLKVNHGSKSRDDGSNWIVDHSSTGGSRRPGFRTSGSSWGGGGAQLAPICQDKLRLDSLATVTVPPLPPRM
jgi:uncharacterized membrane protein YgcG